MRNGPDKILCGLLNVTRSWHSELASRVKPVDLLNMDPVYPTNLKIAQVPWSLITLPAACGSIAQH